MEMLEARRNDILVLALKGRLGATSVPSVLNHLQKRIDQGKRQLALDAAGPPTSIAPACGFWCKSQDS